MSVLNLFPLPRYLQLPAFGLDLSDRSLKYAELLRTKKEIRLGRFGEVVIPQGIIENGEIKKRDELVSLLKKLQKDINIIYATAALPEEKVFLSTVQLPSIEPEEIPVALESQLEKNVPLSPAEAVFDYEVLPETVKNHHVDVNLAAVSMNLVDSYQDIFEDAGFRLTAFDLESRALARDLVFQGDKTCQMIVNIGQTATNFIIVANEKVRFTSVIKVAGQSIDKAIARALSVSLPEASRIKKEKAVLGPAENDELFAAILPIFVAISEQITRNLNYWKSHVDEHKATRSNIEKIILVGGEVNLPGLANYFSYRTALPVEYGNSWININSFEDYLPQMSFKESLRFATALGLALREYESFTK